MAINTHASDINELSCVYQLNGNTWLSLSDEDIYRAKCERVGTVGVTEQETRASLMVGAFLGYVDAVLKTSVHCAWWVSRPGMLSAILRRDIDSKRNPSDILCLLRNGSYLGVSCKSGKFAGSKLCFKNPGVGTIENALGLDLTGWVRDAELDMALRYGPVWPKAYAERKRLVREAVASDERDNLGEVARYLGDSALTSIRNAVYERLATMGVPEQQAFFLRYWLDADGETDPRYVKLTGTGSGTNFMVAIEDPCANPVLDAVRAGTFYVLKGGEHGILVKHAESHRTLFRMRAKFKSEKLASTVAFTGEPGNVNTTCSPSSNS